VPFRPSTTVLSRSSAARWIAYRFAGGETVRTETPSPSPEGDVSTDVPVTGGGSRTVGLAVTSIIVLVTLLLGAVLLEAQRPGDGLPRDPIGAEAPVFALSTLEGDDLALDDLRGAPVVLAFWASWCTTCKADVPKLQQVVDDWGPEGVRVIGVVIEDALPAARAAADSSRLRYPSVFDPDGTTRDAFGVLGTPETFLLDAEGRVAARWIGPLPAHELDLRLAALAGTAGTGERP
jgi:cytochrome c biogenesis protein CcmG, thiol:disulfide interchange protein DsbE